MKPCAKIEEHPKVLNFVPERALPPKFLGFTFYNSSGRLHEGMRELERILDKPEVILSAPMLLTYAHKQCETVGKN